jgi:alkylhydroperoxidase/carboxymuconolactone decarboxylase family protein YurZ
MARCGPCIEGHYKRAIGLGITPEELAEALWCAVFIGGAPVKLFYEETMKAMPAAGGGKSCCG